MFENTESDVRQSLNISPNTILIGMMGRVHFWKGQDYFVNIAGEIFKTHKNVHFLMVGDAFAGYEYLHDNINQLIEKHGLQGHVTQLPYRSDIANIYGAMDVFILPSLLPDPAPLVVTEAMAAGTVVASFRSIDPARFRACRPGNLSGILASSKRMTKSISG